MTKQTTAASMRVAIARVVRSPQAGFYVHHLKPRLPAAVWRPASSRLLWLPAHASVIVVATLASAQRWLPWPCLPLLSLMIGLSFAGLMFLGHEVMHGALLRGRWARMLVGGLCFAPLCVSPHLWTLWHNRIHHANANRIDVDPDMYASLDTYRNSRMARFTIDNFALGGRRWRGLLSIVLGFSVQSAKLLVTARARLRISPRAHVCAIVETLAVSASWIAIACAIGASAFVFAFVLPVLVANAVVMSFIVTNHSLCSASDVNDPMISALSVTTARWIEWLTLDFGYHVEHHLFPAVSARHGRAIRTAILALWPERYQSMPLLAALSRVFETGRIYRASTTLVDPRTGGLWPTLSSADHLHESIEAVDAESVISSRRAPR
jgi:fatty acid desaturase